jgi:Skp family chaperone for outer membrane proteins
MRVLSSICAAAIIAAAALLAAPEADAQRGRNNDQASTVVVIDYQRVLAESALGRDIQAKLTAVRTEIGAEAQTLQPEQQAIEAESQRLQTATRSMSAEQIRNSATYGPQYQALAQRLEAFQRRGQSLQGDLECTQLVALRDFDTAISPVVRSITESRGAGVVLDARNVQMTLPAFDITALVIQQLDQNAATRTSNVVRRPVTECVGQQQPAAQ